MSDNNLICIPNEIIQIIFNEIIIHSEEIRIAFNRIILLMTIFKNHKCNIIMKKDYRYLPTIHNHCFNGTYDPNFDNVLNLFTLLKKYHIDNLQNLIYFSSSYNIDAILSNKYYLKYSSLKDLYCDGIECYCMMENAKILQSMLNIQKRNLFNSNYRFEHCQKLIDIHYFDNYSNVNHILSLLNKHTKKYICCNNDDNDDNNKIKKRINIYFPACPVGMMMYRTTIESEDIGILNYYDDINNINRTNKHKITRYCNFSKNGYKKMLKYLLQPYKKQNRKYIIKDGPTDKPIKIKIKIAKEYQSKSNI